MFILINFYDIYTILIIISSTISQFDPPEVLPNASIDK